MCWRAGRRGWSGRPCAGWWAAPSSVAARSSRRTERHAGGPGPVDEGVATMIDPETTIGELKDLVRAFSRERDWEQFHHPKDLGVALACEVGEVLEHFRYRGDEAIRASLQDAE